VHPEISWQKPDGGMAFWLETGQDSTLLAKRAQAIGVQVYPERDYTLKSGRGTHLRLGFSGQTEEENNRGLSALFSVF
jgi:DNA-binding transcriptional MocR family regulator